MDPREHPFRARLGRVIFGTDTVAGRLFDVVLLWAILLSVAAVCLESVPEIRRDYGALLFGVEWFFTVLFGIEYLLRLFTAERPLRYARSFFGVVDLLAVLPSILALFWVGAQSLIVVRALRLLRVFRVLKLVRHSGEAQILVRALQASRPKITVFVFGILTIVVIVGAIMYLVEGSRADLTSEARGEFTSIPRAMWWAIVTLTTVGYGDVVPQTALGRGIASLLMILGYGIIAVPTGIVTSELVNLGRRPTENRPCPDCDLQDHDPDAAHCKRCGAALPGRA